MKLSSFRRDSKPELEGVWESFGGGLRVLVARMGNPRYNEYLQGLQRKMAKRRGRTDDNETEELVRQAIAKHILLSWEGLEDDDGNLIEPTEENRAKVLADYPNFQNEIVLIASDAATFALEHDEALEGN